METNINTPQELGKALKSYFKTKYGIEIRTRYIKTVRGLSGSWYEISSYWSKQIIPNEFRAKALAFIPNATASNPNDIHYGNIGSQSVCLYGRQWIEFLKSI